MTDKPSYYHEQFLNSTKQEQNKYDLDDTVLNLSDYLSAVSMVVSHTFDHKVWVKAEIRNLSSKAGHYYFELAEKSDDGKVIASCRATLWRYQANVVLNKFRRATGSELTANLTVMLKVAANFHSLYGFSLNIDDIDPNYTLGDLARQYAAMVERLDSEGLLHANKQIPKPFDIKNVLVIAPQNAAGLGDFRKESDLLQQYGVCQFHYYHATFQGNHAPKEIREAISLALKRSDPLPDVVVIIRGGGAVGDLAYLNDYELAALVAELPMPVWVGIGHERDRVILDEVAQRSFDTPSKVVAGIIHQLQTITQQAKKSFSDINAKANHLLAHAHTLSRHQMRNVELMSGRQIATASSWYHSALQSVKSQAHHRLSQANQGYLNQFEQIKRHAFYELKSSQDQSEQQFDSVKKSAQYQLSTAKQRINHIQQLMLMQHPKRTLDMGYVLVKDTNGKLITSIHATSNGQSVELEFKDGNVNAIITKDNP